MRSKGSTAFAAICALQVTYYTIHDVNFKRESAISKDKVDAQDKARNCRRVIYNKHLQKTVLFS